MDFHLLMIALVLAPVFTPVHCQVACNARSGPVRQKRIVLSSPGTGGLAELDTCQYRVAPWSGQVCQVRVDFERLELPQPQLNANSGVLECVDFLQIQHFRLCGRNSGQHLYIPIRRGQELQLLFRLATSLGRQSTWQLTLTQLECPRDSVRAVSTRQPEVQTPTVRPIMPFLGNFLPRTIFGGQSGIGSGSGPAAQLIQTLTSPSSADLEMLAPLGCDQYYRTTTGGIVSFNFAGGVYMPNMKYSICVKGAADNEISYKITHFELSKANSEQPGPAYDTDCRSTVLTPLRVSDYVSIPDAYMVSRPELQATYYCGNGLAGQELVARPPFVLRFASDSQSSGSETGFQLTYTVRRSQDSLVSTDL
ncbi:uncharacterized protein LOC117147130 [Drosophila mauritiana]|uniref:Uncharacterized protein LOC117147130 n=1 Tax=Drosophila mauritiana TaxID=7226 RepID=A0A6P8KL78_DROMA|nr:uncharacterized protein LOC117147130 [Drosophila mauritiana]